MADSFDKIVYSFVMEDVLKGLFVHVPPGYVACVHDLGRGVLRKVLSPGLHLKIPFWQKAKLFNTQTLEYSITPNFNPQNIFGLGDTPIKALTYDGKRIEMEATILLRLDISQIPIIWQTIGEDFVQKIIRPTIQSRLRMIASKHTLQDIVSLQRDQVEVDTKNELVRIFAPRGIIVENILLSEVQLEKVPRLESEERYDEKRKY